MKGLLESAASALVLMAVGVACSPKPETVQTSPPAPLTFIENDYPRALAQARQSNLPLFVEVWAPW